MPELPLKAKRVRGGVHLEHHKNTADKPTAFLPPDFVKKVTIPLKQHIGAPCAPAVNVGDAVKVGTLIGEATAPFCAPIYASVSGTVTKIAPVMVADGSFCNAVEIESDGQMTVRDDLTPPTVTDAASLIEAVRQSGLVGLGGTGFPSHIKLTVSPEKPIDTLIINCAECEPFSTADHRECLEDTWDILNGIYTVKRTLGIHDAFIAVEDNKPDAIRNLLEIAGDEFDPHNHVHVVELKSSYPQGAEKVMVKAVTGREIPAGKLPADVGVLLMNVTSVAFISRYLKTGMPLVSKRVTVDGLAVERPQNVFVPIGTQVSDLLRFVGLKYDVPSKVIMGGPMMGTALSSLDVPVVKTTNAVLAFKYKQALSKPVTPCIRCGRCVKNCPMGLVPLSLAAASEQNDLDELNRLSVMSCMECGTCVYNCPAGRKLVQAIRLGKKLVRDDDMKKKEGAK